MSSLPIFVDTDKYKVLCYQLYVSLKSMPCRCTRRWNKMMKEGYEQTHACSRCVAIDTYEASENGS